MFSRSRVSLIRVSVRNFSLSSALNRRPPPKEESASGKRRKSLDPFDRRWKWTPKSAEPYNVKGGHLDWTKITALHRGVQLPGYVDKETGRFIHVEEMVPEIVVPDLKDCNLKPYVSYKAEDIGRKEQFTAKDLFDLTYKEQIVHEFKAKMQNEANKTKKE